MRSWRRHVIGEVPIQARGNFVLVLLRRMLVFGERW
jgi:hypothetical protein